MNTRVLRKLSPKYPVFLISCSLGTIGINRTSGGIMNHRLTRWGARSSVPLYERDILDVAQANLVEFKIGLR